MPSKWVGISGYYEIIVSKAPHSAILSIYWEANPSLFCIDIEKCEDLIFIVMLLMVQFSFVPSKIAVWCDSCVSSSKAVG